MHKKSWKGIVLISILLVFVLSGCTKTLDIDDSGAEDMMVLNAVPMANKEAFVNFTNTHFFLDSTGSHPVLGAELTLWINGVPYRPSRIERCNYFFNDTLRADDRVAIDITSPKGDVHAETYIPPEPEISRGAIMRWKSPTFNFFWTPFKLTDHVEKAEYYRIMVTVRDSGLRYSPWRDEYRDIDTVKTTYYMLDGNAEIRSSEVSPNLPLGGVLYSHLMFTDKLIAGEQDYNVNCLIPIIVDTNEVVDSVHEFKHWYTVSVESITPERMRYLISVARSNSMSSYFAEQAQPYTNIEGGNCLGVFAGAAKWSFTFDPDTLIEVNIPELPINMKNAIEQINEKNR